MRKEDPETSVAEVLRRWWRLRRLIGLCSLCGLAAGSALALLLPRTYTSTVKLLAETEPSGTAAELSGLTSLVGIDLDRLRKREYFDPSLYPEIVASTPFLTGIARTHCGGREIGLYVPGFGRSATGGEQDGKKENAARRRLLESLRKRITVFTDKRNSLTTITVELNDPSAAAEVADSVYSGLERYLASSRTRKAQADFTFTAERLEEARARYYAAQEAYARYQDANRHTALESTALERNRLYQEQQLAFQLYSQLSSQLEIARLKVRERTPVLTVIEPAVVPLRPSSPHRSLIVLGGLLLGAAVPMGIAFLRATVS